MYDWLCECAKCQPVAAALILAPVQHAGSGRKLPWESNRAQCNAAVLLQHSLRPVAPERTAGLASSGTRACYIAATMIPNATATNVVVKSSVRREKRRNLGNHKSIVKTNSETKVNQ
jgi:hypothetical protein